MTENSEQGNNVQNINAGLDTDLEQENLQDNQLDDGNNEGAQEGAQQEENQSEQEQGKPKEQDKQTDKKSDDIYGAPETFDYSEVQLPDGMQLDEELLKEFEPVAKKLNLSNKSANELMSLAVKLSEKNVSKFSEYAQELKQAKINSYYELLNNDKELNANNEAQYNQYLDVAIKGLKAVSTEGFRELLKSEGLTHHPEFIKTFHKIGELCVADKIPDAPYPTGQTEIDTPDILYGQK